MERSEQLNELAAALAKAQGAVKNAAESGKNPHLKSAYSTLADVWDACRKPLSDNGLSVTQFTEKGEPGMVRLVTLLLHSSGQFLCGDPLEVPVSKHDAQSYGSSLTYARRYGLAALVGVCPADSDDDGEAAKEPESAGDRKAQAQPPAPKDDPDAQARKRFFAVFREKFGDVGDELRLAILTALARSERPDSAPILTTAPWRATTFDNAVRLIERVEDPAQLHDAAKVLLEEIDFKAARVKTTPADRPV